MAAQQGKSSGIGLTEIKAAQHELGKMGRFAGSKRPMILIVDDDAAVRDSLQALLGCEGYETREFASGREFLASSGAGERDCLILDVNMPGMSGMELLETMRRRGDMHPVIVISGHADSWTRKLAHAAGALAIIDKPYRLEEFLELVKEASAQG